MSDNSQLIAEFENLVKYHDLTYMYSDDGGSYRAGSQSLFKINQLAEKLPREDAVRIWNAKVDRAMHPDYRKEFYWK